MKKKKNLYKNISLFLILGTFAFIVFGTSYALLSAKLTGKRNYAVEIGNLDFSINQEDNGIRLLNAFPMNDEYGKTLNPYTFSLTNTGTIEEDYTITLVEDEEEKGQCNGCEFLVPNKLRYELKVNGVSQGVKMLTSSKRLDYGTLGVGETNNYELRIWLKESATTEEANKYYYGRIKVDATQTEKKEFAKYDAMMMARTNPSSTDYFWKYSKQITSVVFEPVINIPSGAENWDVSATANSGQVMAYVEDTGETVTVNSETLPAYKLHIQAKNGVAANAICYYLFADFTNLVSIDGLKYFDTSIVEDMRSMFSGCRSLTSLDLSNFDTSNVSSMFRLFYYCSSLTSLDLSGFDTSEVTSMYDMFSGCSSLVTLDINDFDTSKVQTMADMFYGCSSLTSLDVSGFDTSKVTSMYMMFTNCSSLASLDVSGFDTSNVTSMGNMFGWCRNLTFLDVSNFDTSNVTEMYQMFNSCGSLMRIDVSNFNTSKVTSMKNMFYYCSSLTSLDVSNFDTSKVTDMSYMFSGCSSLTSLDVGNFDTSNVESMTSMFGSCSALTSLDLSNFDTSMVADVYAMFSGCSSLTILDLSNFDVSKVTSNLYMFEVIPVNSLITVKDEAMKTWVLGVRSDLTNVQVKSA